MKPAIVFLCLFCLAGCAIERHPEPPPMPRRPITTSTTMPAGDVLTLDDRGMRFTLFLPPGYQPEKRVTLTMNFHGAPWFIVREHQRHGHVGPVACFALGEGSNVYRIPFEDRERFGRVIKLVEQSLQQRWPGTEVTSVEITSFSAGYGAVREIVKSPEYVAIIRQIVLGDSMYASWEPASTQPGATSRPLDEQIRPWVDFASRAANGEKVFVFTYSQVPTGSYAPSFACAHALNAALGLTATPVEKGSTPAASDAEFPLIERCDRNGYHVWGYGGVDGQAHITHIRHLADIYDSLNAAPAQR